jgi:flagellar hook protein FlgE
MQKQPKQTTSKKQPPKKHLISYSSFSYSQVISTNGKTASHAKTLQVTDKNGKVVGKYKETKNGKTVVQKQIKNKNDLKSIK